MVASSLTRLCRRTTQPQAPVEVDRTHPLGKFVALGAFGGGNSLLSFGGPSLQVPGVTPITNATDKFGRTCGGAIEFKAVGDLRQDAFSAFIFGDAPTIGSFGSSEDSNSGFGFGYSSQARCYVRVGSAWADRPSGIATGTKNAVYGFTFDGLVVRFYAYGALVNEQALAGLITHSTRPFRFNGFPNDSANGNGRVAAFLAFNKCLTTAEVRSISENPWQVLTPVPRRTFFLPATGGGGTVGASAPMSSAPSVLAGVGALPISGSASLAAGAATMAAAGSLPVASYAAMATAPAVLAASGSLAIAASSAMGTAAATQAASGALLISGSAAMSTLSAMLSASGALPIAATAAQTTGAAVMSADGALGSDATASASMATAPATVAGAGVLPIAATASQTTGSATMAASGDLAGTAGGSASMATAPATTAAQGLLQLLAAAGMQTSTPILVAFGSEPSTGPAIDWTAPGASATVPQASVRALVPEKDIAATIPAANVRAIVPLAGADMDIIKTFDHQVGDTEIYELAYGPKYIDPLGDTPATLAAFTGGHAGIAPEVAVGAASGPTVKFAVDGTVPVGSYTVSAQLATAAGRKKTAAVVVKVDA